MSIRHVPKTESSSHDQPAVTLLWLDRRYVTDHGCARRQKLLGVNVGGLQAVDVVRLPRSRIPTTRSKTWHPQPRQSDDVAT
jgi:hypothetical protein